MNAPSLLLSVVVPTFNDGLRLPSCLDSIYRSVSHDHEVIVVDDGTSNALALSAIRRLQAAGRRQKLRIVRQDNLGLATARNHGLQLATGRYIKFLDADDFLIPDSLDLEISVLNSSSHAVLLGGYSVYHAENKNVDFPPTQPYEYSPAQLRHVAGLWEHEVSIPIHCALFDQTRIRLAWKDGFRAKEDWIFWSKVFETLQGQFYDHRYLVGVYHIHGHNMTRVQISTSARAWIDAYELLKAENRFNEDEIKLLVHHFRTHYMKQMRKAGIIPPEVKDFVSAVDFLKARLA